ncbi:MAG: hypothetical protein H0W78_19035 [Planctomycetes bacterium]|nr:hypothetical protein [Planctomycetota bacterium]
MSFDITTASLPELNKLIVAGSTDATSGGRRDFDHWQKSPWKSSVLDWIQSDFWWSGGVTVMDSSNYDALSRRKVRGKPGKRCTTDICALRILDRILEHGTHIELAGRSWRTRNHDGDLVAITTTP